MAAHARVNLAGSDRSKLAGSEALGPVNPSQHVQVTVVLRRKSAAPVPTNHGEQQRFFTHEQLRDEHGADPADIAAVEKFAHDFHLAVAETSLLKRRVMLTGTAEHMQQAFGTTLTSFRLGSSGEEYRGRHGWISLPSDLADRVIAVLGMDTRPVAKPHFVVARAASEKGFTPPEVARLYNYPSSLSGSGQTIAIIELGGGYSATDLSNYFSTLGITEPEITAVSVDGATNQPGGDADGEVQLDIEIVGAIAPGAKIAVYFAPNTDRGFIDAITDAVHDTTRKPSVISISWGSSEDSWTAQSQMALNEALQDAAALGVTVTVAAGDSGSTDGAADGKLHVDFPGSSPYVLACGGTTLKASGNAISSEVVWNETKKKEGATGGGVSVIFPLPAYQSGAGVPTQGQTSYAGRGVPDVAGNADPVTGYQISVNGKSAVVGGTSAVAPLWAALVALINQAAAKPVGFINPTIYAGHGQGFRDITTGNNDNDKLGFYDAAPGWDACTGLGSPDGAALLKLLAPSVGTTSGSGKKRK